MTVAELATRVAANYEDAGSSPVGHSKENVMKYPDDGGLKKQVRPFDPSGGAKLLKHLLYEESFRNRQLDLDL